MLSQHPLVPLQSNILTLMAVSDSLQKYNPLYTEIKKKSIPFAQPIASLGLQASSWVVLLSHWGSWVTACM